MDIERPLYWHQGLFLQPQHFQLLERSLQSLLLPFYDFAEPHFWGVGEMEIQKAALGTRSFSPLKGNLLFSDGSHAVFPGNAVIEPRPFDEAWVEGGSLLRFTQVSKSGTMRGKTLQCWKKLRIWGA